MGLAAVAALALAAAPPALADTTESSNWAGYAVHRSGVDFHEVSAQWRQPSASCKTGNQRYSAVWVGLGGYSVNANALEQIGTETDCGPAGRVLSSAWYELVPQAARTLPFHVRPGDRIRATVRVDGQQVFMKLSNLTLHRDFTKTLHADTVDVSSAEWIVEAPSDCVGPNACHTLPLADFGSARFDLASAVSSTGHSGSIRDPAWDWTKIRLRPDTRRFIANRGTLQPLGGATPSALNGAGTSFDVRYRQLSARASAVFSPNAVQAGSIQHPGMRAFVRSS
jgi:hypothetical protein